MGILSAVSLTQSLGPLNRPGYISMRLFLRCARLDCLAAKPKNRWSLSDDKSDDTRSTDILRIHIMIWALCHTPSAGTGQVLHSAQYRLLAQSGLLGLITPQSNTPKRILVYSSCVSRLFMEPFPSSLKMVQNGIVGARIAHHYITGLL